MNYFRIARALAVGTALGGIVQAGIALRSYTDTEKVLSETEAWKPCKKFNADKDRAGIDLIHLNTEYSKKFDNPNNLNDVVKIKDKIAEGLPAAIRLDSIYKKADANLSSCLSGPAVREILAGYDAVSNKHPSLMDGLYLVIIGSIGAGYVSGMKNKRETE